MREEKILVRMKDLVGAPPLDVEYAKKIQEAFEADAMLKAPEASDDDEYWIPVIRFKKDSK